MPTDAALFDVLKAMHGVGVKRMVSQVRDLHPNWAVDSARVRSVMQSFGERHAELQPAAAPKTTVPARGSAGSISNCGLAVPTLPIVLELAVQSLGSQWVFRPSDADGDALTHSTGLAMRTSSVFGRYLVAARAFRAGEALFDECPLIEAERESALRADGKAWAEPSLRAFCAAPAAIQSAVLKMQGELCDGSKGSEDGSGDPIVMDVAAQVGLCTGKHWRRGTSDDDLTHCLTSFNLNAWPFGNDRHALFALGSKFAHSCNANVRYDFIRGAAGAAGGAGGGGGKARGGGAASSSAHGVGRFGVGRFSAKRDIAIGEMVTTNYLGENDFLTAWMSTPARS